MAFYSYRPPWTAWISLFLSWMQGLASAVVAIIWWILMPATQLLGHYIKYPLQPAETVHRKSKNRHKRYHKSRKTKRGQGRKSSRPAPWDEPPWIRLKFRHRQRILFRHVGSSNTPRRRSKLLSLLAYSAVCMTTEAMLVQAQSTTGSFDTDSKHIGIDNRCTACISHDETDFIGGITASNRWIKEFGGSKTTNVKTGTLRWSLKDDDGKAHTFLIPNSYFVQQGGVRLLSPQHWARTQADPVTRGTGSETTSKQVELFWNGRQFKKTVNLDNNNVTTMRLPPGYSRFAAFCAEAEIDENLEDSQPVCFETTNIVSNDDDDGVDTDDEREEETIGPRVFPATPRKATFNLDGPSPEGAVPAPVII
jgi:hypothetical protein